MEAVNSDYIDDKREVTAISVALYSYQNTVVYLQIITIISITVLKK